MQAPNLADVARVTVTWERRQTQMDPGLLSDLRTGIDKAGCRVRKSWGALVPMAPGTRRSALIGQRTPGYLSGVSNVAHS
jgi:hypothetical protein